MQAMEFARWLFCWPDDSYGDTGSHDEREREDQVSGLRKRSFHVPRMQFSGKTCA